MIGYGLIDHIQLFNFGNEPSISVLAEGYKFRCNLKS